MQADPLVSIITPSYNQAKFLEKTIRSVIDQDYPSIEYLVVDGNSTDGSQATIKRFESRIRWWVSEPDQGQAEAVNKGLSRVRGDIVAWLNSDDFYLPGAIRKAVEAFQKNPDSALIYGDVLAVNAVGEELNHMRYRQWGLVDLMEFNIIGQSSVFINRQAIDRSGFLDMAFHLLLDHQLWLRLAQTGPILYLPELLSGAHYHAQSKNSAKASEFGREAFRILDWMQAEPGLRELFLANEKVIWAGAHRINARYLLDGGQPWPAFKAYLKCLSRDFGTGMSEWHRIIFSLVAAMGLGRLKYLHPRWRKRERGAD
jgi:glycosyltransferase involved in cell wall biosynthesis